MPGAGTRTPGGCYWGPSSRRSERRPRRAAWRRPPRPTFPLATRRRTFAGDNGGEEIIVNSGFKISVRHPPSFRTPGWVRFVLWADWWSDVTRTTGAGPAREKRCTCSACGRVSAGYALPAQDAWRLGREEAKRSPAMLAANDTPDSFTIRPCSESDFVLRRFPFQDFYGESL